MPTGPVSLLGDTISHGGSITSASSVTRTVGNFVVRQGDTVSCNSHGAQTVSNGSPTRKDLDGKKIARIGDPISCGATIVGPGDPDVIIRD